MYKYLYMDESTYCQLMKSALAVETRGGLLARLEETEKEIAQLKRPIGGIYAYADQSQQLDELLCAGDVSRDISLTTV